MGPTLINLVEDYEFISGEVQSKVMRVYAQSGQYHTIVECRDF